MALPLLPTFDICGKKVSRLICGGNPFSGISHVDKKMDRDMLEHYIMPNLLAALDECQKNGVNTFQSRGDVHQERMYLAHQLAGGKMQWIAQTASEFGDLPTNILQICRYNPIAIYHHGTHTDNSWHMGKIDQVRDLVKFIKDQGLPAGIGTHIPAVIEYAEEHGWETDFYMGCFYNLARKYKSAPAVDQNAYARDMFPAEDPAAMAKVLRAVKKPCIAFKIMAASRNCSTPEATRAAFKTAFDLIKPNDGVDVGMFQRHRNQIAENAKTVRDLLL